MLKSIAAVAVASLLLAGCESKSDISESKRDICAQHFASSYMSKEEATDYWKRLGIKDEMPGTGWRYPISDQLFILEVNKGIRRFCEFYRS